MGMALQEKAVAYLESHNVMTLATNGPDGLWAAAVFYASDGFRLYFLSAPATRHSRNIAANPHVAATIQEDYTDWLAIQGVQLEGECQQLDGESQSTAIERYKSKFPIIGPNAPPQIVQALDKVAWYALTPERIFFIDNSVGLGHRDEIPLNQDGGSI